jgi:hypothetical protein
MKDRMLDNEKEAAASQTVVDAKPRANTALIEKKNDRYASDSKQKLKTKEVAGLGEVKNTKADGGVSRAISLIKCLQPNFISSYLTLILFPMVYSSLVQLVMIEDAAAIAAVVDVKPRANGASIENGNDGYASDLVQKLKAKEVAGLGEVKNSKADGGVSRAISV